MTDTTTTDSPLCKVVPIGPPPFTDIAAWLRQMADAIEKAETAGPTTVVLVYAYSTGDVYPMALGTRASKVEVAGWLTLALQNLEERGRRRSPPPGGGAA